MRQMILHVQYEIDIEADIPLKFRPARMAQAFANIGYEVHVVSGSKAERKRSISDIRARIKRGEKFDFVYAESSLRPMALPEEHGGTGASPLLDLNFLRFCSKHEIPIGLFYRDNFWMFPDTFRHRNILVRTGLVALYKFDVYAYSRLVKIFFLPSTQMAQYFPEPLESRVVPLPPGCYTGDSRVDLTRSRSLKLFYVGAMSDNYRMHKLLEAVSRLKEVSLTLCVRKNEWERIKPEYESWIDESVKIVHVSGMALSKYVRQADVGLVLVEPIEYRKFAVSAKLFEYVSHCTPVLASDKTLVGAFVREEDLGWSVEYDVDAIECLLKDLAANRDAISEKAKNVEEFRNRNTWEVRAQEVVDALT